MAGPNPQLTQMAFAGGIDESQRAEVVDPTTGFLTLENVRQRSRGGLSKRYGFTPQSLARLDGTNRSGGYKLFSDGNALCVVSDGSLETHSPTLAKNVIRSRVSDVGQRLLPVPSAESAIRTFDVEYCNGYLGVVYGSYNGLYAVVLDAVTGETVVAPHLLFISGVTSGAINSFSDRYFSITAQDRIGDIYTYTLDTQSSASLSLGFLLLTSVVTPGGGWATCSLEDRYVIAYWDSGLLNGGTVNTYNQTGLLETASIVTADGTGTIAVAGSNADVLWVAWGESGGCKVKGLTGNSLATVIATAATIMPSVTGPKVYVAHKPGTLTGRLVVAETGATTPTSHVAIGVSGGAAVASGTVEQFHNAQPRGLPFFYGDRCYAPFVMNATSIDTFFDPEEGSIVLGDLSYEPPADVGIAEFWDGLIPVANCYPSLAGGFHTGKVVAVGTKHYYAVSVLKSRTVDPTDTSAANQIAPVGTGSALVEWDFGSPQRWKPATHGESTFLTGGLFSYFDGARLLEVGFLQRPSKPTTSVGGTGINFTNGRRYVAVYEDIDADGNRTFSPISEPSTISGAMTNKEVTITTSTCTVSKRLTSALLVGASVYGIGPRIVFYATLDANNGSPPYYRLGSVLNDPFVGTATFVDDYTDAVLSTSSKLYAPNLPGAVGESLERRAPTGFMHAISYNGSLIGAADSTLFQSGQQVLGEATWFSPLLQYPVPGDGEITGLATQDGTLYVFKRREIYAVAGDYPADNGASGGLGTPRRLAVDVGCIDARSICVTSLGTFFQSERGIELLTRGQSVEWIGEPVQDTVDAFPVCTAATLNPFENTVLFELAATETANQVSGSGRTLVYDLSLKVWCSTDRRKNNAGTADTPAQSAAIVFNGTEYRYAWLGTDGRVYVEDDSTYLDGSNWVTMRVSTGWFKMAGIQGTHALNRVLFLGRKSSDHNLSMSVAYDYSSSFKAARTWTHTEIAAVVASWPTEQLEHQLHVDAEGQSMRMTIEDATPTSGTVGTGAGATWIALSIEGMPKNGAARLPSTAR